MVKDRLPELQKVLVERSLLTTYCDNIIQEKGALDYGYEALLNREYVQDFLFHITATWQDIHWIRENVEQLRLSHSKMIASPVVDKEERKRAEDKIDAIQRRAKRVHEKIKECEKDYLREQLDNPTSAVFRIIGMQRETLTRVYFDVMSLYNICQIDFQGNLRNRFKRQLEIAGHSANNEELEEMLERGTGPSIFTQDIKFQDAAQAEQVLADIEERHNEILNLEKSLVALHELFVNIRTLVADQEDKINLIEEHVLKSVDYCAKAVKETKKASVYVKSRRKEILIIAVLVVILLVVIIGFGVGFSKR